MKDRLRKMVEKTQATANWVINITEAAARRGIDNPYQLWQKIGGSKQTTAMLFSGKSNMIRLDTMNKIEDILGIRPFEYIRNEATAEK